VRSQLYGITPHDPITIVAAALALAVVALVAGYIPARRATRVNPVLALRYE
jgi:putative ABC transport system permease protein